VAAAATATPVREALAAATDALRAAGCETPRLDAELLLAHALGAERTAFVLDPGLPVPPDAARLAGGLVRRRARREPVAYLTGRRGFRRLELLVDRRVLVPRPETELVVEAALEAAPRGARVHDVGTGSGAIALALADERPDLVVSGSDASAEAIEVARANAERLGLEVELWVERGLPRRPADLVVANLPYVREDEWPALAPEITRYEPRQALVSGVDGLEAIRALVAAAPPGLPLLLEHAPDQAPAVRDLLDDASTRGDLAGHERVTAGHAR
jgi:release factor glutamine methyltransferase